MMARTRSPLGGRDVRRVQERLRLVVRGVAPRFAAGLLKKALRSGQLYA